MKNDKLKSRKNVFLLIAFCIYFVFVLQLFRLQIVDPHWKDSADSNAFLQQTQYPARGLIYDRNGKLLVYNKPAYDVMIVMKEVTDFDTLDFCSTAKITKEEFKALVKKVRRNRGYSKYTPQLLISQLSIEEYAVLSEKLDNFPGFYIQNRTLREYTYPCAAHALGSVGEVSKSQIENDSTGYYVQGDYVGKNGVEKSYEEVLRGEKGYKIFLRDAHGKIKGNFEDGKNDKDPISGKNLILSLDIDLQYYGEQLMQGKIGSIVAIEPATGEILALVSSPSFNPSDLVGRQRGKNFEALNNDPLKPLLDRPLMARYPPGSTFKVLNSLIFQQEGIITPSTRYPCSCGFVSGGLRVGCHAHASPVDLRYSIQTSCNAYYCYGYRAMIDNKKYGSVQEALEVWKNAVVSFGFGYKLGVDFPNENRGYIPNKGVYNKIYGERGWRGLTIISNSIGQGEVITTPIQTANLAACVANRGYWITPHIVKEIEGGELPKKLLERHQTVVDECHFEPTIDGMERAVLGGTVYGARLDSIRVCGKTGTAQNPHGKDHSICMLFAPREDPKIAIAVFVENGGFGATWAVPIASLMMEKYLKGEISPQRKWQEERILKASLIPSIYYQNAKKK